MKADLSSDETPEKHTQTKILWCGLGAKLKSCRFKSQNKEHWGSKVNNNRCLMDPVLMDGGSRNFFVLKNVTIFANC